MSDSKNNQIEDRNNRLEDKQNIIEDSMNGFDFSQIKQLGDLRVLIDEVDVEIHHLLNKRAALANQVANIKIADAKKNNETEIIYYRPEREAEVLHNVMQRNNGPLSDQESARLFREIMSACLALEQPLNIAYLGPEGTFTQAAAYKHFGHSVNTQTYSSINQVFKAVELLNCDYGVVPIENSTEGVISHTLDLFVNSPLQIIGEVSIRIHHNLMSTSLDMTTIKTIYSHQQSLAQCRIWLDEHYPNIVRVPVNSNAEAARLAQENPNCAAIAGEIAANLYQLTVHHAKIEDNDENTTRFLILGNQQVGITKLNRADSNAGDLDTELSNQCLNKTSLLVSSENKPGALFELLKPIAENKISMTNIESRPSKSGLWQYVFFIDIEGHVSEEFIAKALEQITEKATMVKVLGSYPQAVL